ncbi:MAG: hypothetical protein RL580_2127, partial [Pseudomonadota bacterium]
SEGIAGGRNQSLDVGLLTDIGAHDECAAPGLANPGRHFLGRRSLSSARVIDDDIRALAGERESYASADTRAAAGDERNPSGESHAFSAPSTSSSIFLASPNNIRLFSLKNSGLSTPA